MKPLSARIRLLFYIAVLALGVYEVYAFLRLKHDGAVLFSSTKEMVLLAALIAVSIVGILVKSRGIDSKQSRDIHSSDDLPRVR